MVMPRLNSLPDEIRPPPRLQTCANFAGNILSVFVLSCPEMRSNFNQLLIALSVFDLLYLVMSLRLVRMGPLLMVQDGPRGPQSLNVVMLWNFVASAAITFVTLPFVLVVLSFTACLNKLRPTLLLYKHNIYCCCVQVSAYKNFLGCVNGRA